VTATNDLGEAKSEDRSLVKASAKFRKKMQDIYGVHDRGTVKNFCAVQRRPDDYEI
jgi:hypothetical protein